MNNSIVVEQEIIEAEKAPAPQLDKIVSSGEDGKSLPVSISSITGNDYVWIYDTVTRERSKTTKNMLPSQLRKVRPDGSRVFTTVKPKEQPARGTFKCMLHPDSPERAHYDEIGLATCNKSNLTSPYQVRRHMEKRHKDEWATIKEERDTKEKEDALASRERERVFMEKLASGQVKSDVTTSKVYVCDECGKEFETKLALTGHKRSHK